MPNEQKTVFISYRRNVASYIARSIFLDLRAHRYDVFMDVESINAGQFEQIILNQIEARAHFLIILTPGTLERCSEPGDWLRREIEYAVEKGRNVVPLFVNDFKMDDAAKKYLTGQLDVLPSLNGLNIHHDYFDEAMNRLRKKFLKQPVVGALKPISSAEQSVVKQKIETVAAQPAPTEKELGAEEYFVRAFTRNKEDYEGKIVDYTEAIRLNPQFIEAYGNRGAARDDKGDFDGAIADYEQVIRLNPQDAKAYFNLGIARGNKGDLEGAIRDFDQVIRLNPQDAQAYTNRGVARYNKGDLDNAIDDCTEAIRLNPQDAQAYSVRGAVRGQKGDLDNAIDDCTEAIRLNPQDAQAYTNRGILRYHKGDLDNAIDDCTEALHLIPQDVSVYGHRAEAYFASAKFKEALVDFKQADGLRPGWNYTQAGLAITYFALGRKITASVLWHTLLLEDIGYRDADWVGKEFSWRPELVEAARKLIAEL